MAKAVCGICGKERRQDSLVCPGCFTEYRQQAFEAGGVSNLLDWAQRKAGAMLSDLQTKRGGLATLQEKLDVLDKEVGEKTTVQLKNMLSGERISQDEWREMWNKLRNQVWREKRGNALYAQFKQLEAEIACLDSVDAFLAEITNRRKAQQKEEGVDNLLAQVFPLGTTKTE